MKERKINKHYQISESILEDLKDKSKDKFKNEISAIEYYLKVGLKYQEIKDTESVMLKDLNRCKNDITYVKKLLEQMFCNKKFLCNRLPKDDEALKDFKKNLYRDKFYD